MLVGRIRIGLHRLSVKGVPVASVAEVKAAIDAAMQHVQEGQEAVRAANEKLGEAQLSLAAAVEGSGH